MAVDVRTYSTQGRRGGLLPADPYQIRRATRARLAAALVRPLKFAEGHDDLPCTRVDPELFFPGGEQATTSDGRKGHVQAIQAAKAVCRPCPVRLACRQWALDHREHGVWGGTSEGDRELLTGHRPSLRTAGVIA